MSFDSSLRFIIALFLGCLYMGVLTLDGTPLVISTETAILHGCLLFLTVSFMRPDRHINDQHVLTFGPMMLAAYLGGRYSVSGIAPAIDEMIVHGGLYSVTLVVALLSFLGNSWKKGRRVQHIYD